MFQLFLVNKVTESNGFSQYRSQHWSCMKKRSAPVLLNSAPKRVGNFGTLMGSQCSVSRLVHTGESKK